MYYRIKNERDAETPVKTREKNEEDAHEEDEDTNVVLATDNKYNNTREGKKEGGNGDGGDKLDFLFKKQGELFKKNIWGSDNRMKNLYNVKEPFDGYRVFM